MFFISKPRKMGSAVLLNRGIWRGIYRLLIRGDETPHPMVFGRFFTRSAGFIGPAMIFICRRLCEITTTRFPMGIRFRSRFSIHWDSACSRRPIARGKMDFTLLIYRLRLTRQRATGALKLMWVAASSITGSRSKPLCLFVSRSFSIRNLQSGIAC